MTPPPTPTDPDRPTPAEVIEVELAMRGGPVMRPVGCFDLSHFVVHALSAAGYRIVHSDDLTAEERAIQRIGWDIVARRNGRTEYALAGFIDELEVVLRRMEPTP